jgi:hypothetical protein
MALLKEKHETKLIDFVTKQGFKLVRKIKQTNHDEYIFEKNDNGVKLNLEIAYNGVGYCISTGRDDYIFYQNNKFQLNWRNVAFNVYHFALDKDIDLEFELGGE